MSKGKLCNGKVISMIRKIGKGFRTQLEKGREKNPKVFNFGTKLAESVWVILSMFAVNITDNTFLVVLIMSIAFGGMYAFQWALMTNRRIREVEEARKSCERKQAVKKQMYVNRCRNLLLFMHTVAHDIKIQIVNMPHQKKYISGNHMANFLAKGLNSLEDILSERYGTKISASVKLCTHNNTLKTYARGKNNIDSRGGIAQVQKINKKEIEIEGNYAYRAIIEKQLQYFAEGNLEKLSDKFEETDVFFCEYGESWKNIFKASIVIPIRYPVREKNSEEYNVLEMVCIDAPKIQKEWNTKSDSYAYKTVAFFADALYNLIDNYMRCPK